MHTCHSTTCGNSFFLSILWVLRNWQLITLDSKVPLPAGPPLSNFKDLHFPRKELPSREQPSLHFVPGHFSVTVLIFHEHHIAGVLCLVHFTGRYCSQVILFMLWYEFRLLHFIIPTYSLWRRACFVTPYTCGLTAVNSCVLSICVLSCRQTFLFSWVFL